MLRKLMIRTWFGPLPNWTAEYCAHVQRLKQFGWDFWIVNDLAWYAALVKEKTGYAIDCKPGTRKCGDYDPAIGHIFAHYLKGYDFWGHVGLDCVFGRVERYMPDEFLESIEVYGNDPRAICGPFSIYRNIPDVNTLYQAADNVAANFTTDHFYGFDETEFSRLVIQRSDAGKLVFASGFQQEHDKQSWHMPAPKLQIDRDGSLWSVPKGREIMMFHFNRKDKAHVWPVTK